MTISTVLSIALICFASAIVLAIFLYKKAGKALKGFENRTDEKFKSAEKVTGSRIAELDKSLRSYTDESINDEYKKVVSFVSRLDDLVHADVDDAKKELNKNLIDSRRDLSSDIVNAKQYSNDKILELKNLTEEAINQTREDTAAQITNLEEATRTAINNNTSELNNQIAALAEVVENIREENKKLRKQLEFYTEIGSDVERMNEYEDLDERERLIQQTLNEIAAGKNLQKMEPIKSGETQRTTLDLAVDEAVLMEELTEELSEDLPKEKTAESDVDSDVEQTTTKQQYTLSILDPDQNRAFNIMETTHDNLFITGSAGTGKSFLIEVFVRSTEKMTVKLAPTGIAARNIQGVTLHSLFGFNNLERTSLEQLDSSSLRLRRENRELLREVDTLIIDEISMVRADVLDKIERILQIVNNNRLPFGGKQLVALGDLFQLPPVLKQAEYRKVVNEYGGVYFFNATSYKNGNFKFVELSVNHRQESDYQFYDLLNRAREGIVTDRDIEVLNGRLADRKDLRRVITLFPTRSQADELNRQELRKIAAKEYTYPAEVAFNRKGGNQNIEASFPISDNLTLRNGAAVMMVNNDPEGNWVNGTMGAIKKLADNSITVTLPTKDGGHGDFKVNRVDFTEQEAVVRNGRVEYADVLQVSQFPLVLAYAITIHKSQGRTFPTVACDIASSFASGQAYVALSRCSSLEGLYLLNKVTKNMMITDPTVVAFYHEQKDRQKS